MAVQTSKRKRIMIIAAVVAVLVLAFATPSLVKYIQEEKRAHEFYEYLMDEADKYVAENISEEDIYNVMDNYKENSLLIEEYLELLSKDSVAYVKDIKRGAHLINNYDKTISFEQAEEKIREEGYNIIPNVIQFASIKTELSKIRIAKKRLREKNKNIYFQNKNK